METPLQREKGCLNHILAMDTRAQTTDAPLDFIAVSQATVRTVERARDLATVSSPVLITGPPGSGKRALALAQHAWSGRPQNAFTLDCSSLQPDELSQYAASNHTLIFNNVGDLSAAAQSELLCRLKKASPDQIIGPRMVATSAQSLTQLVESGVLLDEVASHFSTIQLTLDPLFLRSDDVIALSQYFLNAACLKHHKRVAVPDNTLRLLPQLHFPLNVASLKELITHTVIDADDNAVIPASAVETLLCRATPARSLVAVWTGASLKRELVIHERRIIQQALLHENGKVTRAARILGLKHQTLTNRLHKHHPDLAQLYLRSRRRY